MPTRSRVVVLFGGRNTEHDVSCRSAASVVQHLDRGRYEVVPIRITSEGHWVVGADTGQDVVDDVALRAMTPEPAGAPGTMLESLARGIEAVRGAEVVLPILHGPYGEDGTVQSVLELAGVPYMGSGVLASATSMDKDFTKRVLGARGIPVAPGAVLRTPADELAQHDRDRLGLPVFVKPSRGGSSVGVTRVDDWAQLPAALELARESDTKTLVEAGVPGREVDIGVLELPDGRLLTSPPLEIKVVEEHGWFDYEAKYQSGITDFVVPAELDPEVAEQLATLALDVFLELGCSGLLRVDFFLPEVDGVLVPTVNEVNTIPGLTSMSQFPRMWQAAGTSYPELLDILIETARARGPVPAVLR
ncbi:D-alanine-D-alanine ligase [Promicromonospora sp. AC04]|uniref:D-alanine--D-alanine ligase family protein n=1 Tax=Promicromonospora sp. AC04 TaxID=2135723 RepID=UPI000D3533A3|nr:D-alanine--D-alanine ligase family protein [Promicromonospora sp. AC04]PUB20218.1 D-alanine-D-alanine ligase [Promicromonospora sp. AC04]